MRLGIVLLTYNRFSYAKETIESTLKNIRFDGDVINIHIADDGTDDKMYVPKLCEAIVLSPFFDSSMKIHLTNSERRGYGANYNLASQLSHEINDYLLMLEDDWEATRPIQVDDLISDMSALGIGCARLGYIGYTQKLLAEFRYGERLGHWLEFDPQSPEPHVFAGHPRLESVVWQRNLGPWPEGLNPGETEFKVAHNKKSRSMVGFPIDYVSPKGNLFVHIGTDRSY